MILAPLVDHALHDPGRLVGLGHVLGGEDLEVGERLLHRLRALVGGLVVAEVVLRADEDEADRLAVLARGGGGPGLVPAGRGGVGGVARTGRAAQGQDQGERAELYASVTHGCLLLSLLRCCVDLGRPALSRRGPSRRPLAGPRAARPPACRPRTTSTAMISDVGDGVQGELVDAVAPGLQGRRQGQGGAEQVGAGRHLERLAGGEDHHGAGDEAPALGHVLEPGVAVGGGELGPADAGQHPAEGDGAVLHQVDPVAVGGEHLLALPDAPDEQAPAAAVEHPEADRHEQVGQVGQRVVLEQDRAEPGDVGQDRDGPLGEGRRLLADVGGAEQRREPEGEEQHHQAVGQLVGLAGQHEPGVHEGEQRRRRPRRRRRRSTGCRSRRRWRSRRGRRPACRPRCRGSPRRRTRSRTRPRRRRGSTCRRSPRRPGPRWRGSRPSGHRLPLRCEAEHGDQHQRHEHVDRGRRAAGSRSAGCRR